MREYFDANNLPYGISGKWPTTKPHDLVLIFDSATIPTSFWYLRWFPLDKMMKYVNWVNLMSYDMYANQTL